MPVAAQMMAMENETDVEVTESPATLMFSCSLTEPSAFLPNPMPVARTLEIPEYRPQQGQCGGHSSQVILMRVCAGMSR